MKKGFLRLLLPPRLIPLARLLYYRPRALLFVGNQVICPFCGAHLRCFLPYSGSQNALCPYCFTLARHRTLWFYLLEHTNLFSERLRVLHVAPEYALQRKLRACPNLDYTSADLTSVEAMEYMDITAIPYADKTVDVILCSHVLEHIPDDRKAMREICRILKPGGWAILLVPFDPNRATTLEDPSIVDPRERERLYGQPDHVRLYGKKDYIARLKQAGFTVTVSVPASTLDPSLIERHGLQTDMTIFHCTKLADVAANAGFVK